GCQQEQQIVNVKLGKSICNRLYHFAIARLGESNACFAKLSSATVFNRPFFNRAFFNRPMTRSLNRHILKESHFTSCEP
ncbi:MAG: hypothetical protein ABSF72_11165, partial [Candidatus Sulfotelmatobacter sp.]